MLPLEQHLLTEEVRYSLWFFTSRIQSRKQWYLVLNLQYGGIDRSTFRHGDRLDDAGEPVHLTIALADPHASHASMWNAPDATIGPPPMAHNRSKFRIFCRFMSAIALLAHGNRINRNDCLNNCRS